MRSSRLACLGISALICLSGTARAQCRDDDVLVGEDEDYYYCSTIASSDDFAAMRSFLDNLLRSPTKELLGDAWRYRKALIDTVGCLARNHEPYKFGIKLTVPEACDKTSVKPVDCSGLVSYGARYAACFVSNVYGAAVRGFAALQTDADGQADLFKQHHAFLSPSAVPSAGDFIFFEGTYDKNHDGRTDAADGITHVAIYLGRGSDGKIVMIHASSRKGKVVFSKLEGQLSKKLVGYGNVSALALKTEH